MGPSVEGEHWALAWRPAPPLRGWVLNAVAAPPRRRAHATIDLPERPAPPVSGAPVSDREWFSVQAAADGAYEIDIYDEIGFWGVDAARLVREIKSVSASLIRVNLNSPGGDVWDSIAIYNALVEHEARVEVKVDALAASGASVIAQAGDWVQMAGASQMMIHEAFGVAVGTAEDMEAMAILLEQVSANLADLYWRSSGELDADAWRELMKAETWYNAEEAVAAGLADEALPIKQRGSRRDPEAQYASVLSHYRYPGRSAAPEPARLAATAGGPGPGSSPGDAVSTPGAAPGPVDDGDNPVDWEQLVAGLDLEGALLNAADAGDLGADTLPRRLERNGALGLDPDVLRAAITDRVNDAPAKPTVEAASLPAPTHVRIADVATALKEGLS